jgi:hypothetical protein
MKTMIIALTIIAWAGMMVMRDYEYEKGYEHGAMSMMNYRYMHEDGSYISYGFREYLRKNRMSLPRDKELIDSIEGAYLNHCNHK